MRILFLCLFALSGCSSITFEREVPTSDGAKVLRLLSIRNTNIYGGKIEAKVDGHGVASLTITPTPAYEVPRRYRMKWDRSGIMREYEETPLVAQINQAEPLRVIYDGTAWIIRSVSNLAGTIGAALMGGSIVKDASGGFPSASN